MKNVENRFFYAPFGLKYSHLSPRTSISWVAEKFLKQFSVFLLRIEERTSQKTQKFREKFTAFMKIFIMAVKHLILMQTKFSHRSK